MLNQTSNLKPRQKKGREKKKNMGGRNKTAQRNNRERRQKRIHKREEAIKREESSRRVETKRKRLYGETRKRRLVDNKENGRRKREIVEVYVRCDGKKERERKNSR